LSILDGQGILTAASSAKEDPSTRGKASLLLGDMVLKDSHVERTSKSRPNFMDSGFLKFFFVNYSP